MQFSMGSWMRGAAVTAAVGLAVAVAPVAARAGTVSETVSFPSTLTNWSTNLHFQGFTALAPALQTLDSVTFTLTETMAGKAFATNNGSTSATGNFVIDNTATLNAGTFGTVLNHQTSASVTIAPGVTSPTQTIAGTTSASTTLVSSLAQFLPGYTGTASDSALEGLSFGGGNLSATFTDLGALSVLVTYTYHPAPVPEPASIAFFAMGLLGLGFVRFKRA